MIMMTQQARLRCVNAQAVTHDPRQAQGRSIPRYVGFGRCTWRACQVRRGQPEYSTHSFNDGGCAALSQRCSVRSPSPRFEQTV